MMTAEHTAERHAAPLGNAAIYYVSDAYDTNRRDLKGRHAAGAGFLAGLARHIEAPAVHALAGSQEAMDGFARSVRAVAPSREACWIQPHRIDQLSAVGNLYMPDPLLADQAWRRRAHGARAYSLCGVTHSICSTSVLDGLGAMLTAPTQSWDAVICTSSVARAVVEGVWDEWGGYLSERFGGGAVAPRPQAVVIPLGVDANRFDPADKPERRRRLRERHGIGADDVVFLFFGRLSFHAKAHPVAMLIALEQAAQRTRHRLVLMLTGRFPGPEYEALFTAAFQRYCPSVRAVVVDGADDQAAEDSWCAGDVFVSLSDNIQETFGLTPVEAMAAGLPALVTDWDGYRDTVANGETGLRIPTAMPAAGSGFDMAAPYFAGRLTYDRYIGTISQCTAVDIRACADAMVRLAEDADLRRRMGAAGRARVLQSFDWRVVIRAYQELWGELDARRRAGQEVAPCRSGAPANPLRDDPFATFRSFPTMAIQPSTILRLDVADPDGALTDRLGFEMNTYSFPVICTQDDCRAVVEFLRRAGPSPVSSVAAFRPQRAAALVRASAWLIKMGIVSMAAAG